MDTYVMRLGPGESLPSIGELQTILKSKRDVELHYTDLHVQYLDTIKGFFTSHLIYHKPLSGYIFITPYIPEEYIMEKKAELLACAIAFREDANRLMAALIDKLGYQMFTPEGWKILLIGHEGKYRNGQLDATWRYHLHGNDCRFENTDSGQVVEVKKNSRIEFGFLDAYFFTLYMRTTVRFKSLAEYFNNDDKQMPRVLDLLAEHNVLRRMPDGIIAL